MKKETKTVVIGWDQKVIYETFMEVPKNFTEEDIRQEFLSKVVFSVSAKDKENIETESVGTQGMPDIWSIEEVVVN